jgi:NAD(P)-dependent dehydrogenase (short-subunit alcohol dehydrogenase family)
MESRAPAFARVNKLVDPSRRRTAMSRITTPYGAETDADEIVAGLELPGRRMIVTGGGSGIGIETARSLARSGAEVTIAVRRLADGQRVAREIAESTGNDAVSAAFLDLSDHDSVLAFLAAWNGPLDVLVNNAGVMACPLARSAEGWELQFATNHLGHFALASGLHGALAAAGSARVVSVSSSAHQRSPVVFDDIHYEHRVYEPWEAYGQSKTANVLFAVEATRRWADDGIAVNALMPGGIATNLQRHIDPLELERMRAPAGAQGMHMKTPQQGASTSVLLAVSPLLEGVSGRYFDDCNEAEVDVLTARRGVASYALDPDAAARLWEASEAMLAARRVGSGRG